MFNFTRWRDYTPPSKTLRKLEFFSRIHQPETRAAIFVFQSTRKKKMCKSASSSRFVSRTTRRGCPKTRVANWIEREKRWIDRSYHSYGENLLTYANLHMSRFAHVSKSKFAMRSDESYVPWANTRNIIWNKEIDCFRLVNFRRIGCVLTIWVYRTAGGCSWLRETKIKHPVHRLLRQNNNIIIFRTKIKMKKECLEMLQKDGTGGMFSVGTWFLQKLSL